MDTRKTIISCVAAAVGATLIGGGLFLVTRYREKQHEDYGSVPTEEELADGWVHTYYCPADEFSPFDCVPQEARNYGHRLGDLCKKYANKDVLSCALDIGCSAGGVTFELATSFQQVTGLDKSKLLIEKCNVLKQDGMLRYKIKGEGSAVIERTATVNPDIDRSRVNFIEGDACSLPNDIGQYGLVLAANILCLVADPLSLIEQFKNLVVANGTLVIVDSYTYDWGEDMYAQPKDRWIGGYTDELGEEVRGFATLKKLLSQDFDFIHDEEVEILSREHERFYWWVISHVTVWHRK